MGTFDARMRHLDNTVGKGDLTGRVVYDSYYAFWLPASMNGSN